MSSLGAFLQNLRNFGLEYFGRYYSLYPAKVVSVLDPEKRGRVKVQMLSLLKDQILPQWVLPVSAPLAGKSTGSFFPPYEGEVIQILFDHGDLNYPFYIGGFWAKDELPQAMAGEDYPNVKGFAFKSGQKLLVNETPEKLSISLINADGGFFVIDDTKEKEGIFVQHKNGALLQLQTNGSIVMTTPKGNMIYLNEQTGEVTLKSAAGGMLTVGEAMTVGDSSGKNFVNFSKDSVNVVSSQSVNVNAPRVNLEAGQVRLGKGASLHAVIYERLKSIFDAHTHATVMGPSGPPLPPNTMGISEGIPSRSVKAGSIKIKGNT